MSLAKFQPKRVGVVFSGGPAPAANAVISSAASAFRRSGSDMLGFLHGYSGLQDYDAAKRTLVAEQDYHAFTDQDLHGLRNERGIFIGTSRANPGKGIRGPKDLDDPQRTAPLRRVYDGLVSLGVEALVSIGGDDTLKTANFLYEFQRRLPADAPRVRVVHVPKTIDNDYRGIDFTFGFFTAVDVMAQELLNLRADARATKGYFVVETMGRKAGWLAYGVAIAGEAHMVVGVEDVEGALAVQEEIKNETTGAVTKENRLDLDALAERIVDLIVAREARGKHYGTIVLAEGLAELLPESFLRGVARDEHGHVSLGKIDIGKLIAKIAGDRYEARTGKSKKLTGVQLGYESRCSAPHAFDVMLGCQLGLGAFRAIVEEGLDGHMVSTAGQLDLQYVPFAQLVNPETLKTEVRFIERGSDFHRLARDLETRLPGK
ncbi:6-phosphofructokinase [Chondromyces crocatus]|uniref:6-phosphofructokinase n=1 Tax=Chondromyces crocatus TaxID=52 RepID=A0A0K1EA61_CHOCO|nr:6-phosphofructokinase [Chondromyces crocatus]AKT37473.1 6-phosphofructokinase [Chondromyces crocatus]